MTTEIGLALCFAPLEGYALPGLTRIGGGSALGTMHDDGGFPAVVHGGDGVVHGTLWSIDEAVRDETLAMIDLVHGIGAEGSPSPHARTIVVEGGRLLVHSWHWRGRPPSPAIPSGRWTDPQTALPLETDRA
jgi:gamma-glutamylcyclotransferase (GGCT)/AIG2-like uncharacterized protein YtfP